MSRPVALAPTSTAALLIAANPNRRALMIRNEHDTVVVYLGTNASVTAAAGFPIHPTEVMIDESEKGDIWAITASSTGDLRVWETY